VEPVIYWLYEWLLRRDLTMLPEHICFMITDQDLASAPESLMEVTRWCRDYGIRGLTFHISTPAPEVIDRYLPQIREVSTIARMRLHYGEKNEEAGEGMDVTVAVGKSGREEITACIRRMAEDRIVPEQVNESTLESYLTFNYTPDLVIKTGENHLTDFLIWQSVYSELFFADVNWEHFRKVDFLRALRDYQARKRRFGK
jgi:undecaprenyl diphosphate synthase